MNCLLGKTQRDCSAVTSVCMFLSGVSTWLGVKRYVPEEYSLSVVQLQCCHSRDKRHEAIVVEQQSDHRQNDLVSLSANVPQDVCCWCWDGLKKGEKKKWKEKRQQYRSLHRLSVEFSHQDLLRLKASVSPSHLGIWAAGCRVACSRQMAARCLLCRSASNARILNHQTWICCRSLLAEGDTLWVTIRETTHYCAVTNESSSEHMEPATYHITKTETR